MANKDNNILIYNPYTGGHYFEFFYHLLNQFSENPIDGLQLYFCIPSEYKSKIDALEFDIPSNVTFCFIPEKLKHLEKIEKGRAFEIINNICEENNIKTIFFPHIERARKVIALIRKNTYSLHGILFYPFSRISYSNHSLIYRFIKTPSAQLQNILSAYKILFNKDWKNVFILNDKKAIKLYRKLPFIKNTFEFIPDPISQFSSQEKKINTKEHYNINPERKLIVCLGSLIKRKNVHRLIMAAKSLNKRINKKFTLLIAGTGDRQYIDYLNELTINDQNIIFDNRFLSEIEFNGIIQDADVVAIPYLNFFWSSGLLNHAIFHEKKVLASDTGLISEIVKDYNFGEIINPYNIASLEQGIHNLLTKEYSMRLIDFYRERKPTAKAFGATILQSLSEH